MVRDSLDAAWRAAGRGHGSAQAPVPWERRPGLAGAESSRAPALVTTASRYPAGRMRHVLAVVGGAVARSTQHRLRALGSVWEAPFAESRAELVQGPIPSLVPLARAGVDPSCRARQARRCAIAGATRPPTSRPRGPATATSGPGTARRTATTSPRSPAGACRSSSCQLQPPRSWRQQRRQCPSFMPTSPSNVSPGLIWLSKKLTLQRCLGQLCVSW